MTEAEWLACDDPIAMIELLRGSPTGMDRVSWWHNSIQFHEPQVGLDRRFRLLACQFCRRIWDQIPEPCNREAVVAVEQLLERQLSPGEAQDAFSRSSAVEYNEDGSRRSEPGYWVVKYLGRGFYKMTAGASALLIAARVIFMADEVYGEPARFDFDTSYYAGNGVFLRPFQWPLPIPPVVEAERSFQVALLRDIFSNPFRPVTADPSWLTSTVRGIAEGIYADRAFDRMPILADALEDAGCDNADILAHCRGDGPHVRGCWVVDLILGKN